MNLLAPSENSNGETFHRTGLGHEYVNIVLWNHSQEEATYPYWQRNPSWFAEGLSEYLVWRQSDAVFADYPPRGVENLREQIQQGNGYFSTMTGDVYNGGHLLVEYLVDEYDYETLFAILANDAPTWGTAVQEELGLESYLELNIGWLEWAAENIGGDYTADLARLADRVDIAVSTQLDEVTQERDQLQTQLTEIENERDRLASELEDARNSRNTLEDELAETRAELNALRDERDTLEAELAETQEVLNETREQRDTLEAELEAIDQNQEAAPTETTRSDDDGFGAGFGIGTVLTGVGGAAYLLKLRVDTGDD